VFNPVCGSSASGTSAWIAAVVFRPGVLALGDLAHAAQQRLFPLVVRRAHVGVHAVAPGADLAVHRPHHQRVAAAGLEFVEVGQRPRQGGGVARLEYAGADLGGSDGRERGHGAALRVLPERRMGDVDVMVRVERDRDLVQPGAGGADERGGALHVGMGAGHGQGGRDGRAGERVRGAVAGRHVAEVVLRVDDQELGCGSHGAFFLGSMRSLYAISCSIQLTIGEKALLQEWIWRAALQLQDGRNGYPILHHRIQTMSVHPSHPDIIKRLKRAEGHLRSIVTMLEEGRDCLEIAQQMQAVESAVANAKKTLVHDHIDHCLEHAVEGVGARDAISQFKAITKYL
jgi:DNA-binding FrmR family transcriptional regulator